MNILIVSNRKNRETTDALYQIIAYLDSQGISHVPLDVSQLPDSSFLYSGKGARDVAPELEGPVDLVVTLGGDGTLLHTARLSTMLDAPILGMNFGHLGFLANSAKNGVIALLADALSGEICREERVNLHVCVECEGDDVDEPTEPRSFFVLNEIAITRGAMGHIVDFDLHVSGDKVAHLRGDGVIVSTATGSTAYALSAGGPLVGPSHRGMIVVPLAPHTFKSRSIVTEHHDIVEVTMEEGSASAREVSLFADGDALEFERPVSRVIVSTGDRPTVLLNRHDESFYHQIARTFFD
ncbi:MAG: NAD(+)/NADH kinase [Eggerthellaceae bacterium]|nr:NAD(+)/NADH kinase [Eggerthellaceae bacterium]